MSILKSREKAFLIAVDNNSETYCAIGYNISDALSAIAFMFPDRACTVEIKPTELFVSQTILDDRKTVEDLQPSQ